MEAVKGFIFGRDKKELDGKSCHSYLVSFVIITDEPLDLVDPRGETVVMGVSPINTLTPALQLLTKYKPPYPMGEAGHAIMMAAGLNPENLEKITTLKVKS